MNAHSIQKKGMLMWTAVLIVLLIIPLAQSIILHPAEEIRGGKFTGDTNYTFDDFGSLQSVRLLGKIFIQNGIHTEQRVIVFSSNVVANYTNLTKIGWVQLANGTWTTPGPGAYIITGNGSYIVKGPGSTNINTNNPGIYNTIPNANLTFISSGVYIATGGLTSAGPQNIAAYTTYRNSHWWMNYPLTLKDDVYATYLWLTHSNTKLVLNTTKIPQNSFLCKRANDSELGHCSNDLNPVTGVCTCI